MAKSGKFKPICSNIKNMQNLYEDKGDQFFDGDKMICPYDRNNYKDELAEAKHQCMIKNNIIILKGDDIKNMKERI